MSQPWTSSGVNSCARAHHGVREREGIGRWWIVRVREHQHAHPGRVGGADPVRRVLDRGAARRVDAEPARGLEIDVRSRLPALDLLGRDDGGEQRRDPGPLEHGLDQRPVRGRRDAERELGCEAAYCVDGAVDQRQFLAIAGEHPANDLGVDLLRRLGQSELVVHVARPLR